MSDFLKKFSKGNYQQKNRDKSAKRGRAAGIDEQEQNGSAGKGSAENGSAGKGPAEKGSDSSAGFAPGGAESQDTGIPADARDELYEKDPDSDKRKIIRIVLSVLAAVVLLLGSGALYYYINTVRVPDFVGDSYEKVRVWGIQNNVHIEQAEDFSPDYDRGLVLFQSPEPGEALFKGRGVSIKIIVSKGADPAEVIPLPDFTGMNIRGIEQWITDNRAENVSIVREYDDEVPANAFIRREFRDMTVTDDTYRRADRMIITVSRGAEEIKKDIEVPDFTGKPETEAAEWASAKEVKLETEQSYSDTEPEGHVIRQSIEPETRIAKNEELTITVSKGQAVYAPCFAGMSREEAETKASLENVNIIGMEEYHHFARVGELISQSVPPGEILTAEQNTIILHYSLGLPFIPDLSGQTEQDIIQLFADMNSKKAGISYWFEYVSDGHTPKGTALFNTRANTRVPIGSQVTVTISTGGRVIIGDYIGQELESEYMHQEIGKLESQGLKIIYEYVFSDKPGGTIVGQSIKPGEKIYTANRFLRLEISN